MARTASQRDMREATGRKQKHDSYQPEDDRNCGLKKLISFELKKQIWRSISDKD